MPAPAAGRSSGKEDRYGRSLPGYSPNYLSRRFRQAVGIGVHQYLMFIRLQHAANELLSTNDSVTEIAFRCGFVSSNYFKDAFKNAYGVSPRDYRKGEYGAYNS